MGVGILTSLEPDWRSERRWRDELYGLIAIAPPALKTSITMSGPCQLMARAWFAHGDRPAGHQRRRAFVLCPSWPNNGDHALERAIAAHPDYAPAGGLLAFCLLFAMHMGWIERDRAMLPAHRHAIRAIALDDRHHWGHIALGYWAMMSSRTSRSHGSGRTFPTRRLG